MIGHMCNGLLSDLNTLLKKLGNAITINKSNRYKHTQLAKYEEIFSLFFVSNTRPVHKKVILRYIFSRAQTNFDAF